MKTMIIALLLATVATACSTGADAKMERTPVPKLTLRPTPSLLSLLSPAQRELVEQNKIAEALDTLWQVEISAESGPAYSYVARGPVLVQDGWLQFRDAEGLLNRIKLSDGSQKVRVRQLQS